MFLMDYNITGFSDNIEDRMTHQYKGKEYKPNELKKYLLQNDEMFKEIQDIDENQIIILFYGRGLSLLKIIPYDKKIFNRKEFESLIEKRYLKG